MRGLISYSLYGDDPRYIGNAVQNKDLADKFYPGWDLVCYVDDSVPMDVIETLRSQGFDIIDMTSSPICGVVWRCLAVDDTSYDAVIVRDIDSRLSKRESEAVHDWLDSDKTLHSMRDAKEHNMKFQTGMWGCKPKQKLFDMTKLLSDSTGLHKDNYQHMSGYVWRDQTFSELVFDNYHANDIIAHDDWLRHSETQEVKPFPTQPRPRQHVGYAFIDCNEENEDIE